MKTLEAWTRIQSDWQSKHQRRSVERDVKRWTGWQEIEEKRREIGRDEGHDLEMVYVTTFETGGRITEVLHLEPSNFRFDAKFVEHKEHGFAFDVRDGDIYVVWRTSRRMAVQDHIWDFGSQSFNKIVAQDGEPL